MTRRIFDNECLLKAMLDIVKGNLNSEILLIDIEKADYILDPINDNAWYFQQLGDEVFSYQNFVVWGSYGNPDNSDTTYGNSIKQTEMYFEVVVADDGSAIEENIHYKMLRYTRALESAVNKNFSKVWSGLKVKVINLTPTVFDISNRQYRSAGIKVVAAISTN